MHTFLSNKREYQTGWLSRAVLFGRLCQWSEEYKLLAPSMQLDQEDVQARIFHVPAAPRQL